MHFGGDHVQATSLGQFVRQLDVGSAAGHVGGHRHPAALTRLGHHVGLAFVPGRVEDLVADAQRLEPRTEFLGGFDRRRADQHRPVV